MWTRDICVSFVNGPVQVTTPLFMMTKRLAVNVEFAFVTVMVAFCEPSPSVSA